MVRQLAVAIWAEFSTVAVAATTTGKMQPTEYISEHQKGTCEAFVLYCRRKSCLPYCGRASFCPDAFLPSMRTFCSVPRPIAARVPHAAARRCVTAQVASHPMDPSINLADFKCVPLVSHTCTSTQFSIAKRALCISVAQILRLQQLVCASCVAWRRLVGVNSWTRRL